jgi:hypothetical protein
VVRGENQRWINIAQLNSTCWSIQGLCNNLPPATWTVICHWFIDEWGRAARINKYQHGLTQHRTFELYCLSRRNTLNSYFDIAKNSWASTTRVEGILV